MNLAKKGELPAKKLGRLWRFEETSVKTWLETHKDGSAAEKLSKGEIPQDFYKNNPTSSSLAIFTPIDENLDRPLSEMFIKNSVKFTKSVTDKREVFELLATLAFRTGYFGNYQSLVDSLIDREQMFSTAYEGGIAFPHPRRPLDILNSTILAALVIEEGIYFGAPDSEPTKLFILICSPSDAGHVKILSRLAYIFRDKKNVKKLIATKNPEEFLKKFNEMENYRFKNNIKE